jgi:hypothetical protein
MHKKYITNNFLMIMRFHVCGSWNITKKMKCEKIMQWRFIKFSHISYGNGFFIIRRDYYAFIAKYMTPKNEFQVSSQNNWFTNGPRLNSCISIPFTITQIHPKISPTTVVFKYVWKFSNFMTYIILSQMYSIQSTSSMFLGF